MLNVGIMGIGNAGGQVANKGNDYKIKSIALNSSSVDLSTLSEGLTKIQIGKAGMGSGKDRNNAKKYLGEDLKGIVDSTDFQSFLNDLDVVFVVCSLGGGTGSGTVPVFAEMLTQMYPAKKIITVGIMPDIEDSLGAQGNGVEALSEIISDMTAPIYMIYDNVDSKIETLNAVNEKIIKDIMIIQGQYNYPTAYDSIDDRDMLKLISVPGRLSINSVFGFGLKDLDAKSIESMILDSVVNDFNVEYQYDGVLASRGLITNLTQKAMAGFDINIPAVTTKLGEPIEAFRHIHVSDNDTIENVAIVISSGMSFPEDRMNKVNERIESGLATKAALQKDSSELLDGINTGAITELRNNTSVVEEQTVDLSAILGKFGV